MWTSEHLEPMLYLNLWMLTLHSREPCLIPRELPSWPGLSLRLANGVIETLRVSSRLYYKRGDSNLAC